MKNIEFIPKEFHDVKLDLYDGKEYPCTPRYPEVFFESNIILLNAPQKIIYKSSNKDVTPIIPLCAIFAISQKRGLKYDHLSIEVIHIRRIDQNVIYSGDIVDPNLRYEHPALPPNYEEREREREEKIKEAQKYSDEELDEGMIGSYAMNINLFEYVNMPLSPGKYEIYLSAFNLESNKVVVEIIIEGYEAKEEATNNNVEPVADKEFVDVETTNDRADQIPAFLETSFKEDLPEI